MVVSPFKVVSITGIEFPVSEVKNIDFRIVEVSTGAENIILHSTGEEIFKNEVNPFCPFITTCAMLNCSGTTGVLLSFLQEINVKSETKRISLFSMNEKGKEL